MERISKSVQVLNSATQNATKIRFNTPQSDRYCKDCDREFSRPSDYRRHLRSTVRHNPSGARVFVCDQCNKKFTQICNLKTHKRLHSGVILRCDLPINSDYSEVCQSTFADISNLRAHIRRQHLAHFSLVPSWLEEAVGQRFSQLRASSKRPRPSTRRRGEIVRESLSSPDSLLDPSPPLPDHIIDGRAQRAEVGSLADQVSDLEALQPSQFGHAVSECQALASQPEADVDGWNALFASLSESTSYPSYPDTLPLETLTYCAANPQPFSINDHNHYPYFGPVPLTEDQLISNLNSSTVLSFPDLLDNTEQGMYGDYHYHWGQFGLGCWTEDAGAMGISAHDL